MSNILLKLYEKGLATGCPPWLPHNTMYLTIMGSHAYGVADTSVKSKIPDYDVYGWTIPSKSYLFPHLDGHIKGFGPEPPSFEQWQKHHIFDEDAFGGKGKEWDLQVFSIVKYFELCRQNNPNMIDSLFTPENCVVHCTQIGRMVRDKRKLFLSKEAWKKFRGYAHAQLKKMTDKEPIGGRREIVEKYSYDVKFAYHIIRLLDEAEQILLEGDMDLQRAREPMKAIRRGDWKEEDVRKWAMEKEKALEVAYTNCKLPEHAPLEPIRLLLVQCLEEHYGSMENCVSNLGWAESTLKDIDKLLDNVRKNLYTA
jgi:predicted nucleotidyltransferase